jgi:DNA-binding HxlR family transcriptional regulator
VGSSSDTSYCAFTKAIEHLGDRWCLLIIRELAMFGPQGFNALATGLPGHVSRSVLTERLRRLEQFGLIARSSEEGPRAPYRLARAGEQLVPALMAIDRWAGEWVPEDPAIAERDPSVIVRWLHRRLDPAAAPQRTAAVEVRLPGADPERVWLLVGADVEPTLCKDDPLLGDDRYVYLEADPPSLMPVARGVRTWREALADQSVRLFGAPDLVAALPSWFGEPGAPTVRNLALAAS